MGLNNRSCSLIRASNRHRGLLFKRAQLSLFICCSFAPLISKKELLSWKHTLYLHRSGQAVFLLLILFFTISFKCCFWGGGSFCVVSRPTVRAVRQSHLLINKNNFLSISMTPSCKLQLQLQLTHLFAALAACIYD